MNSMKSIPMVEHALAYAKKGYHVLPCNGKKPLTRHGFKDATTDKAQIVKWFNAHPTANIGLATGVRSGFFVVDIDGEKGMEEFSSIRRDGIPPTPIAKTGGGGCHIFFKYPDRGDVRNRAKIGGLSIDVRGEGGFVVVPPSDHKSGNHYEWKVPPNEAELAEAPEWIIDLVASNSRKSTSQTEASFRETTFDDLFDTMTEILDFGTHEGSPEGKRHDTAVRLVGAHLGRGESEEAVLLQALDWAARCSPPMENDEISRIVSDIARKEASKHRQLNGSFASTTPPQTEQILACSRECEFFHSLEGQAFAAMPVGSHYETWPIKHSLFRKWLRRQYHKQTGRSPNKESLNSAIESLEAFAIFDGEEMSVAIRIAEHNGAIYIDSGDEEWGVFEVDADGWRFCSSPPVRFRRAKGMLALPRPKPDGSISLLRQFLNIEDNNWPLVLGWLVAALRPSGPYPVLCFSAEQGAGKSTTARLLRALVDPNRSPLRSLPSNDQDLMLSANNAWCPVFDNLSNISQSSSDALCRLSTGGGFSTRQLYTNDEEIIFEATRPMILTSIAEIVSRSDLLDRSLIVRLPTIPEPLRRPESEYWREFEGIASDIFGGLLDAVSCALRNFSSTTLADLPRMADFAKWATAAESGLELPSGEIMQAYGENRQAASSLVLDSSPVAKALAEYLNKSGAFTGTTTELLAELVANADESLTSQKGWPKGARYLSQVLRRIAPNLRATGCEINEQQTAGNNSRKLWIIRMPMSKN